MDIKKQAEYWHTGSLSDIDTAGILIDKNKLSEGLFFCHLAIEKILKALYVKNLSEYAPKSHNLFMLCEKSNITPEEDVEILLGILMKYQAEGRYPQQSTVKHTRDQVVQFFNKTKEVHKWFEKML